MKRRDFIKICALFISSNLFGKTQKYTSWEYISSILNHMFNPKIYGNITPQLFLQTIINQKNLDIADINFLLKGIKHIYDLEANFIDMPPYKKEKVLRQIENSDAGSNWLIFLHSISIEAILSDPIYAGNNNQIMWKILNHNPGLPRPKVRYIYGI